MSELNEELLNDVIDDFAEFEEGQEDALLQDDEDIQDVQSDEESEDARRSRQDKFTTERQRIVAPDSNPEPNHQQTGLNRLEIGRPNRFNNNHFRGGAGRGRFRLQQQRGRSRTVLINPRFQGIVPVNTNARLAWDQPPPQQPSQYQQEPPAWGVPIMPQQYPAQFQYPQQMYYPHPPPQIIPPQQFGPPILPMNTNGYWEQQYQPPIPQFPIGNQYDVPPPPGYFNNFQQQNQFQPPQVPQINNERMNNYTFPRKTILKSPQIKKRVHDRLGLNHKNQTYNKTGRDSVVKQVTVTNNTTVKITPHSEIVVPQEDEDDETRELRKKIEEQKKKREELLKWKEARRLKSLNSEETALPSSIQITKLVGARTSVLEPVRQENDLSHLSNFLSDRKVLLKDDSLIATRKLIIKNIAKSTSDKKIREICKNIGEVQTLERNDQKATIIFGSVASAHAFYKKFHRHMLDLSMIEVNLIPEIDS